MNRLCKLFVVLPVLMLCGCAGLQAQETPITPKSPLISLSATLTPVPKTPAPTPTPTPTPTPAPTWGHPWPEIDLTGWQYTLVNPDHALPEDFTPELGQTQWGLYFDARALSALEEMLADGNAAGVYMYASSGYRNIATQQALYERKIKQKTDQGWSRERAQDYAKRIVAYPGTSEHNLGLAADIVDKKYQILDNSFENTAVFKWLYENCARYGFILRYPRGKEEITGITYEPWHYRYVGIEAAEYIMENDLCFEEFLALYEPADVQTP